jgi:hypothetical protein
VPTNAAGARYTPTTHRIKHAVTLLAIDLSRAAQPALVRSSASPRHGMAWHGMAWHGYAWSHLIDVRVACRATPAAKPARGLACIQRTNDADGEADADELSEEDAYAAICAGTALSACTSAPGLRLPLPHLRRDCAFRCHICTGTALTAATSAPGLRLPLPHLHRDSGVMSGTMKLTFCCRRIKIQSCGV